MLKRIMGAFLLLFCVMTVLGQQTIYDEQTDAMKQIQTAVEQASREGKNVFCQVGGNWCPWCIRFAAFVENDSVVNPIMHENFVYIHVNWSKNNKNPEAMRFLGNPARFGFPVFVIINPEGQPIHIQNSAYLEEGKGYSQEKVVDFLKAWTPATINELR